VAFANIFFVSIVGLIPDIGSRAFSSIAIASIAVSLNYAIGAYRRNPGLAGWKQWGVLAVLSYAAEWVAATRVETDPKMLIGIVVFIYLYALLSVWDLLESRERAEEDEAQTP
jgi:carbon starvation protein CstA